MQIKTKIYIALGLAASIGAYFVFRPKKSTIKSSGSVVGGGVPKLMPSDPKPLPFEVQSCPDGKVLVGNNCVPDKAKLLREYQDYSYNKKLQVYDSGSSTIFK
jgi:hypothetical protein